MATRVLNIVDIQLVPFREVIEPRLTAAFGKLIEWGTLRLDFSGASVDSPYQLTFLSGYDWNATNHDRCWYRPMIGGVTGTVNLDALRRRNYCSDLDDCASCEPVVRPVPGELGQSIVYTAAHEAGHILGLMDGGLDGSGHVGESDNFMFINSLHAGYRSLQTDHLRTTLYRVRKGDSLSRIARRIGFAPPLGTWHTLYNFRGRNGRRNRQMLRSGDPDLIYPGEEIWVPDIPARLAYMRSLEVSEKHFTATQLDTMKRFLDAGSTAY